MSYQLRITPAAQKDIERLFEFLAANDIKLGQLLKKPMNLLVLCLLLAEKQIRRILFYERQWYHSVRQVMSCCSK